MRSDIAFRSCPCRRVCTAGSLLGALALAGCGGSDDGSGNTPDVAGDAAARFSASFVDGALLGDAAVVDCTLSGGADTTCFQIEIAGVPADAQVGPFCPPTTSASADEGGIWLDGTQAEPYDADGNFIQDLPNLYSDTYGGDWVLYDADGNVRITDTQAACEAAARPDVDEAYRNYCVECSLDYVDGGVSQTLLIPTTPVMAAASSATGAGTVGVALSGAVLEAPAPVESILSNFTIAAFDDCGGHVNPAVGYHYHAATGCTEQAKAADGHAGQIGYAMDGHAIYGQRDADGNASSELDDCGGESDATRGYHYHAASAGENRFIACFTGETVAADGETNPPAGPPPGGRG